MQSEKLQRCCRWPKWPLGLRSLAFCGITAPSQPWFSKLLIAEPQPSPKWPNDPRLKPDICEDLEGLGAEIVPFSCKHFGADYAYGNKIEMLFSPPKGEPFVFFDTDTLITSDLTNVPFDFDRPSASLRREGTWPKPPLYVPGYSGILKSLYD